MYNGSDNARNQRLFHHQFYHQFEEIIENGIVFEGKEIPVELMLKG
jgi:hypothetical protein